LKEIADKKSALLKRLDGIDRKFLQAELAELDIQQGWDDQKKSVSRDRAVAGPTNSLNCACGASC